MGAKNKNIETEFSVNREAYKHIEHMENKEKRSAWD